MTDEPYDLDTLEALADVATPGPWHWTGEDESLVHLWRDEQHHVLSAHRCEACQLRYQRCMTPTYDDAAYIVAACASVPSLVAEVRRLRDVVAGLVEAMDG